MAKRTRTPRLTAAQRKLAAIFEEGGCLRMPDADRLDEGWESYKKGWEIRFTCRSTDDLERLHALLDKVKFTPGRPFRKGRRWIVPVYGYEPTTQLCEWLDAS